MAHMSAMSARASAGPGLGALKTTADINESVARWDPRDPSASVRLMKRHNSAIKACGNARRQALPDGGWCLHKMESDRLFGDSRMVSLPDGSSYRLPASHVEADSVIVSALARILGLAGHGVELGAQWWHGPTDQPLSVADFGAGVGQYGHELRSRYLMARWQGYDGAGDVKNFTRGFVSFVDLTIPLALPRADWVLSLEVGEHVPREHEMMVVRNLHAHNVRHRTHRHSARTHTYACKPLPSCLLAVSRRHLIMGVLRRPPACQPPLE